MRAIEKLERVLREQVRGTLLAKEPLGNHTSFRVGGAADLLFYPVDSDDLVIALHRAKEGGFPVQVMGNGTNLLVRDGGVRGLTVHMGAMEGIRDDTVPPPPLTDGQVVDFSVLAGTSLSRVINYSVGKGLAGLEFAAGIPGTVGGGGLHERRGRGSFLRRHRHLGRFCGLFR